MREFATQKVDEVCVFGSSRPRIKKKKRERVEMTNLDACWSMHGGMGCINEVAISQVNSSSLIRVRLSDCWAEIWRGKKKIFGLYCP